MALKKTNEKKASSVVKETASKKTVVKKASVKKETPKKTVKKLTAKKTETKKAVKKTVVKKSTEKKTVAKKTPKKTVKKADLVKSTFEKINENAINYIPADVDIVRELPDRYNETKLMLMMRDPEWCYFYWDVSDHDFDSNHLHNKPLHVRIFQLSGVDISKHKEHIDIEVSSKHGTWYIMLGLPHNYFFGELGYYNEEGNFIVLTKSNIVYAPRNTISDLYDEEWMNSGELTKLLFETFNVKETLSSASLFNMINVYTLGGLSSSTAGSSSDLHRKK